MMNHLEDPEASFSLRLGGLPGIEVDERLDFDGSGAYYGMKCIYNG